MQKNYSDFSKKVWKKFQKNAWVIQLMLLIEQPYKIQKKKNI
jgi:hypothetical protein